MRALLLAVLTTLILGLPLVATAQNLDLNMGILEGVEIRVNDEVITVSEVDDFVMRAEMNSPRPFTQSEYRKVRMQIQDRLIEEALLVQEAHNRGYTVNETELQQMVDQEYQRRIDQQGGQEQMQKMLDAAGMSEEALRKQIAYDIERDELRRRILRTVVPQNQQVTIEDIEKFRMENGRKASELEMIELSHILIAVPENATPEEDAKAKKSAEDLLIRIRAEGPGAFERYAKEESDHEASRDRGGSLGTIRRGELFPEFDVAFDMEVGEVSDPIRSPQGYHLLKVTGKRSVEDLIYQQKFRDSMDEFVSKLREDAVIMVKGRA